MSALATEKARLARWNKTVKTIGLLALIPISYVQWANNKWEPANNVTGVIQSCRWYIEEPNKPYTCIFKLSDGGRAVKDIIVNDGNGRGGKVTLKAEVNKLNRKRYTIIPQLAN